MNRPLTTCELPATVQPGHLLAHFHTDPHTAVIIARPGSKNALTPLIKDIIIATSHRPQPTVMPKAEHTLINIALARLIGYRVHHVIVCASEHLPHECLTTLTEIVITAGAQLTLIYGFDTGEGVRRWGSQLNAPDVEWDELNIQVAAPSADIQQVDVEFPDEVPWVDFPLFRATSRQLLTPTDFDRVDRLYRSTFQAVKTRHPSSTAEAAELLRGLLAEAPHPAMTITIVRAAQAAFLALGYLLKADLRRLYLLASQGLNQRLDRDHFLTLRDEPIPAVGAIAVLADLEWDDNTIASHPLADITPDGRIDGTSEPTSPEAKALLATQRLHRLLEGAQPTEPFINAPERTIRIALRDVAKRGIPIDISRAVTAKADRWQHQTGIHLQEIG